MTETQSRREPEVAAATGPPSAPPPEGGRRRLVWRPPALGALFVGFVFWLESLRPTLLPHPPLNQGVVGGLCLLIGYGLGGLVVGAALLVNRRLGWSGAPPALRRGVRWAFLVVAVAGVVIGMVVWLGWQNDQRAEVGMPHISWTEIPVVLAVTVAVVVLFGVVARLIGAAVGWFDRLLGRRLPRAAAHVAVAVVVAIVAIGLGNKLVVDAFLGRAGAAFEAGDATTEAGAHQPGSPDISGGPGSLVAWDSLGLQGRNWVSRTSTPAELRAFAGPDVPVMQPIRAYAGLASAPTVEERARLAVADLTRAGGFRRKVLVVATATGSGWINPVTSSAFEYEWHGDTAMVSMQYSYLPSWIAFLTDRDTAAQAGTALNRAVYAKWSTLPPDARPKLILFGESLGSLGSEDTYHRGTAAASVDATVAHADGILWVGPTTTNPIWAQVTAARTTGSPVWRPTFGNRSQVVFANMAGELPAAASGRPRIVYLQHPSDPVTWWSTSTLYAPPAWITGHPRGGDIPGAVQWFPIVTFLQTTGDLMEGFSTPSGHGHNYNGAWAEAVTSVATPPGWTATDTARLSAAMLELHGLGAN